MNKAASLQKLRKLRKKRQQVADEKKSKVTKGEGLSLYWRGQLHVVIRLNYMKQKMLLMCAMKTKPLLKNRKLL